MRITTIVPGGPGAVLRRGTDVPVGRVAQGKSLTTFRAFRADNGTIWRFYEGSGSGLQIEVADQDLGPLELLPVGTKISIEP